MELKRALDVLGLTTGCSRESLNESFRRLAKQYHPDSNQGSEWAHRKMIELNLAYETILSTIGTNTGAGPRYPGTDGFHVPFSRAINRVLDGVYTYYQYGLENVHLRMEGVRKFRFRDTIHALEEGLQSLYDLREMAASKKSVMKLQVFTDFAETFYQNVQIDKTHLATDSAYESAAFRHFQEGSDSLDYAIKDALFGDDLIQVRSSSYSQKLARSMQHLMVVLREYGNSRWFTETLVKLALLNVFNRMLEYVQKTRY